MSSVSQKTLSLTGCRPSPTPAPAPAEVADTAGDLGYHYSIESARAFVARYDPYGRVGLRAERILADRLWDLAAAQAAVREGGFQPPVPSTRGKDPDDWYDQKREHDMGWY